MSGQNLLITEITRKIINVVNCEGHTTEGSQFYRSPRNNSQSLVPCSKMLKRSFIFLSLDYTGKSLSSSSESEEEQSHEYNEAV